MIRVVLVDDHTLFRQGLRAALSEAPEISVVSEAGNYAQAMDSLRVHEPNVVVADLSMPGRDGIELISRIRLLNPELPVVALSMHEDGEHAARAIGSGAMGYVTKASSTEELISAIRAVSCGRRFVCAGVADVLMQHAVRDVSTLLPHLRLSSRETRIFELLVQCHTATEIARELSLSIKTVSTHKTRLLLKMGLKNQGELVRYAIEHGIITH